MVDEETVGLVIPTYNAGKRWQRCLDRIASQSLKPQRLLVIDSSSSDATTVLAKAAGFEINVIEQSEFNHGGTRQWAVDYLRECKIIVFMTQDAILAADNSLAEIVGCFEDPDVAVAYGRQLPHQGATPLEAHARLFNYGSHSDRKDESSVKRLKSKVFFCSNSFAAYRRSILEKVGGFRRDLILGEDMEFAARAVMAGFANFYCANASVNHSHDYTLVQTIKRYFDLGVFERMNSWMNEHFGSHKGEGLRFVKSELDYLRLRAPGQIPRALTQTAAKFFGYQLGRYERFLPIGLKRSLSMLPSYWR